MSQGEITPVETSTTFTFDIDSSQPLRLTVNNHDGEINVQGTAASSVTVIAHPKNGRKNGEEGHEDDFVVDHRGNQISIRPNWHVGKTASDIAQKVKAQLKEGFRADDWDFKKMRFAGDASYDIEVRLPGTLPKGSSLSFRTTSGDIRVAGINAAVSVATASGDARVEKVDGKVSTHSASGDITLRSITGSVESNTASGDISLEGGNAWTALRSVSGDIEVHDFTLKNARLTTVSGSVSVKAAFTNAADYTVDSVSGDVRLDTSVPTGGATLSYRSMSGDPSVKGDWTRGEGKRSWKIGAGDGGPKISIKTVSGDLEANGTVDNSLEALSETMPTDVREDTEERANENGATPGTGIHGEGMHGAKHMSHAGHDASADADWDKAKGWLKDIAQRVSKFVEDLDTAGDRQYKARTGEDQATTEPITVEPLSREAAEPHPTEPLSPEKPIPPQAPEPPVAPQTPTEPITPDGPEVETTAQRRLRLLEAVQRGELTVDEALAQLDGSGETS